jgi:hypothetical protein
MKTLFGRMIAASRLDIQTYEEVEADPANNTGAVFIVVIASIAAAIGGGARDVVGVVGSVIVLLLTWVVWVGLTYFIGTRLLPTPQTHADLGQIFRTTGFSASPGVLRIFGLLPGIGLPIFIVITFWMLLTFVIAIRQALDYTSSGRALAVCVLGWLIHGFVFFGLVRTAL